MPGLPDPTIPFAPVPLSFVIATAELGDGRRMVVLVIDHQAGRDVHHFPAEAAEALGSRLVEEARTVAGLPAPGRLHRPTLGALPRTSPFPRQR